MSHPTRKLSSSLEGALAGGGDPATSPLYVFGPFLRLIVVGGVAAVTFGATIWLVVFTIAMVSAMYRLVMRWITDGSGGSGLSEEEFGPWAVKVNAGITFIEYTLTFLVSMAAMVTFVADRFPGLNEPFLGLELRTYLAIALSLAIGWLVNRGPKVAARAFGPATAGVLLLLWAMVFASLFRFGLRLPNFNLTAFEPAYLEFTFGGYVRILAVMTGIEVFANLVAAYEGPPERQSRLAFGSLLIVMGTAAVTMLTVGPAILALSNPLDTDVSVFTQAMDALLPAGLAYVGSLVGILVLMSASAASAQGLQNLALGLSDRNYVPPAFGQRNGFGVADRPVWLQVAIIVVTFLLLGTREETYLALYAAGVFILLSLTGWAATSRLIRQTRERFSAAKAALIAGTGTAALLTTVATVIIFIERFTEGAWTYFVFVPILYGVFSYFRGMLGAPTPALDQVGEIEGAMLGGFGYGQAIRGGVTAPAALPATPPAMPISHEPTRAAPRPGRRVRFDHLLVPLDGSTYAEMALPVAAVLAARQDCRLTLATKDRTQEAYLRGEAEKLLAQGLRADHAVGTGSVVDLTRELVKQSGVDLVVASTRGGSGSRHWLTGGVASRIAQSVDRPVLLVQAENGKGPDAELKRILVALDGSARAERLVDYALQIARTFQSEIVLLSVPEVPDPKEFGVGVEPLERTRREAEGRAWNYLNGVRDAIRDEVASVQTIVTGSRPAATIVEVGRAADCDLIMIASRIHTGLGRLWMGDVAQRVVEASDLPVFLLPIHDGSQEEGSAGLEVDR